MTDDWNDFIKLILKDKVVEKCKKIKRFTPLSKLPIEKSYIQEGIIPIKPRDIFIDDRRTIEVSILKKLSRGSHPIDITIDLHGYKIDDAYEIFYRAIVYGIKNRLRLILVITGKGEKNGRSIRSELIKWINIPKISSYILYVAEADKKHGGDGAFYCLLRRRF